jgi:hypothetical protein
MISLAAYRYRNVLASAGGPIERLEFIETEVLGERRFLANAYLRAGLGPNNQADRRLYSGANGSGASTSPMVARFMAISEAMERWAHWQLQADSRERRYGFDFDPSSNGMSAFPGLWRRQARQGAQLEASERFNILHWWEGRLQATLSTSYWPDVTVATIHSPAPGVTVLMFRRTKGGFVSYGHAAASDYVTACRKAAGEMERHASVVELFAHNHDGRIRGQLPRDAHPIERRSLFFATDEGHELFLQRLHAVPTGTPAEPRLVFDGSIPGPWSRYADVWRVLYAPPNQRFLGMEEDYFFL